ncbi:hypothetical protein [Massilia phyllosphaerae]|uniref:hypothetical protein n=1 Tax=Massilia phyllosphaerae TaxID=3106034 RepID=UPI002B1CCD1B|nr:hypothetical protein [Massilia sp. SGZ-792]
MATKQTTPAVETPAAPVEAPAIPFSIRVGATVNAAFQEAVIHARNGYTFSDGPIEVTPTGWAWFTMIRGEPKEYYVQAAKESVKRSADEEAARYKRDIEAAAKRMLEEQQRAKLEQEVADATKALEKQIAALKQAAAAELAKLN